MGRPTNQRALLEAMDAEMGRLLDFVDGLSPEVRVAPGACDAWSVKDLLAHLHARQEMFLRWESEGSAGAAPALPAVGYRWSETPALNEEIWQRTKDDPWNEVIARLRRSHQRISAVIESYDAEALFEKKRYPWTGSTSVASYAVSATSSHYAWASKLVRAFSRTLTAG